MTTAEQTKSPRMLTLPELSMLVKVFREIRQWSQEQLAAISGLSTRTVQRVEEGQPSSLDTHRALARAFEFEDIDALNKPYLIPTEEDMKAQKEAFDKEHITLQAKHIATGKELADLVGSTMMDLSTSAFELPRGAAERYAALIDYYREYRDCADLYSESDKFGVYDDFQKIMDELKALDVSLCFATRKLTLKPGPDSKPWTETALYVIACQQGKELTEFATPRAVKMG